MCSWNNVNNRFLTEFETSFNGIRRRPSQPYTNESSDTPVSTLLSGVPAPELHFSIIASHDNALTILTDIWKIPRMFEAEALS